MSIRILVVDDHAIIRMGLTQAFEIVPSLEPVGSAANSAEALKMYREQNPDVVTMDYHMPDVDGVQCTKLILSEFPDAKIILLSAFDSEEEVWKAHKAGVKAYLTKAEGEMEDLISAIEEVAHGGTYFPAFIVKKLKARKEVKNLTSREFAVLKLIADGHSNQYIGDELSISAGMTAQHILSIRKKLDAPDRTSAVVHAYKLGILQLHK